MKTIKKTPITAILLALGISTAITSDVNAQDDAATGGAAELLVPDATQQTQVADAFVYPPTAALMTPFESFDGAASLGAWYTQADGFVGTAGVEQERFFGGDGDASLGLSLGRYSRNLTFNLLFEDDSAANVTKALTINAFSRKPTAYVGGSYELLGTSVSLAFGRDIAPNLRANLEFAIDRVKIDDVSQLPVPLRPSFDKNGGKSLLVPVVTSIVRDTRQGTHFMVSGQMLSLELELGVGGDTRYLRLTSAYQGHRQLGESWSIGLRGMAGYGVGLSGDAFPVLRNYYIGGPGSVRGFAEGALGGTRFETEAGTIGTVGGNKALSGSIELAYDPAELEKLRLLGFVDMGAAFSPSDRLNSSQLRVSTGVSAQWAMPFGQVNLSLSQPLRSQAIDRVQKVQFVITSKF